MRETPTSSPRTSKWLSVDVGNPAANVIPAEVRLVFNIRFNDLWTPESLEAEIARRVAAADAAGATTLTFEPTNAVAFLTRPGPFTDLVAAAVEDVTGRKPSLSTGGGTSDARFIKNACPVVELGLVNATIHAVDERVALDDLEALSRIYERALERYFADPTRRGRSENARQGRHRRSRRARGRARDAGATWPQRLRSAASSAALRSLALQRPAPTSTSEPTIERTWRCRNDSALASNSTSSPSRLTSSRSRVRIGDFAWHCASRKVEKSCRPTRTRAASCIASASSRGFTRQARPRSSVNGARRLTIR